MREYRETIIKDILDSTDETEVRMVIDDAVQKLKVNGTHPFITMRFMEKLTTYFVDFKSESMDLKVRNNVIHAISVLESYEVKTKMDRKLGS